MREFSSRRGRTDRAVWERGMALIHAIPRSASRLYGDQNCCCSVSIGLVSPGVDGWPGTVSGAIIIVSGGAVAGGGGAGLTSSTAGVCSSLSRWSPPHPARAKGAAVRVRINMRFISTSPMRVASKSRQPMATIWSNPGVRDHQGCIAMGLDLPRICSMRAYPGSPDHYLPLWRSMGGALGAGVNGAP